MSGFTLEMLPTVCSSVPNKNERTAYNAHDVLRNNSVSKINRPIGETNW